MEIQTMKKEKTWSLQSTPGFTILLFCLPGLKTPTKKEGEERPGLNWTGTVSVKPKMIKTDACTMFCQKKRVCKYLKDRNACFIKGTDQVIFVPKAGAKIETFF